MKKFSLIVFSFFLIKISISQSLTPEVVSSHGGFSAAGGNSLSYTTGQVASATLSQSGRILTQGFQQPVKKSTGIPVVEKTDNFEYNLYPNPTADYANLEIKSESIKHFKLDIMDLNGKILQSGFAFNTNNGPVNINMTQLPSGLYLMRLFDVKSNLLKIMKIQKITQ